MMHKSFFIIFLSFIVAHSLNQVLFKLFPNLSFSSILITFAIFIGGVLAGYLAPKSHCLHGLITGLSVYGVPFLFIIIAAFILKFIVHATWTGSLSNTLNEFLSWFRAIVYGGLAGCVGGYAGGILKMRSSSPSK
jgi:hypothetical protein